MTPIAHLASGYLLYHLSSYSFSLQDENLLFTALAGSLAPDIDGLFGNKMNDHRKTIFHAPIFWFILFALGILVKNNVAIIFLLSVFIHLLLDWISARTSGIWLFYPFSKRLFSLFPTVPERGNVSLKPGKHQKEFWKFYLKNKLLVFIEVAFIVLAMTILLL